MANSSRYHERFISVYRLEENGSLLKEGTGDAVGWALTQLQRQNLFLIKFQSVFAPLSFQLVDYQ